MKAAAWLLVAILIPVCGIAESDASFRVETGGETVAITETMETPELEGIEDLLSGIFHIGRPTKVSIEGRCGASFCSYGAVKILLYRFDPDGTHIDTTVCLHAEAGNRESAPQPRYTLEPGIYAWHVTLVGTMEYSIKVIEE